MYSPSVVHSPWRSGSPHGVRARQAVSFVVCALNARLVHGRCADIAIANTLAAIVRVVLAVIVQFYDPSAPGWDCCASATPWSAAVNAEVFNPGSPLQRVVAAACRPLTASMANRSSPYGSLTAWHTVSNIIVARLAWSKAGHSGSPL